MLSRGVGAQVGQVYQLKILLTRCMQLKVLHKRRCVPVVQPPAWRASFHWLLKWFEPPPMPLQALPLQKDPRRLDQLASCQLSLVRTHPAYLSGSSKYVVLLLDVRNIQYTETP